MRVKIFYGPPIKLQGEINKYMKNVQLLDIYLIQTVAFPYREVVEADDLCVLIWLKGS